MIELKISPIVEITLTFEAVEFNEVLQTLLADNETSFEIKVLRKNN